MLAAWPLPFAVGDRFVFVTTGLTAHADGIAVVDGEIDEGPTAVIRVLEFIGDDEEIIPAGPAPLALVFDAQDSTDPSGGNLTYNWNFGDGTPDESGEVVPHTFTLNGSYTVTLTATNGDGAISTTRPFDRRERVTRPIIADRPVESNMVSCERSIARMASSP